MYGHHTANGLQMLLTTKKDRSKTQVSRRRSLTGQARVKSHANPCGICGRQRRRVLSAFPYQYHSPQRPTVSHFSTTVAILFNLMFF